MMSAMREFNWDFQIGLYAGTATGVLVVVLAACGFLLLATSVTKSARRRRSERL